VRFEKRIRKLLETTDKSRSKKAPVDPTARAQEVKAKALEVIQKFDERVAAEKARGAWGVNERERKPTAAFERAHARIDERLKPKTEKPRFNVADSVVRWRGQIVPGPKPWKYEPDK
jgi:hypothetical protein